MPVSSKEFLDIQATIEYGFTLTCIRDMIRTYSQSLLMEKVSKTKGAWNSWPVALLVTKQVQKNSFVSYILSDHVWWYNIKRFLSYSKNYICRFMPAISWHHKLFQFHLSFSIWNVRKGREKLQNLKYLENKKSFLDEIKNRIADISLKL